MLTDKELRMAESCLEMALDSGADKVRVTLNRSEENLVATLNSEVDRVTRCCDSSLSLAIFADGSFGSFSTNKLDEASLRSFISAAVELTRCITPDADRDLPEPGRCCKDALSGNELDLVDPARTALDPGRRIDSALHGSIFNSGLSLPRGCKLISEEAEYSDSLFESLVRDSNGLRCLHSETSFDYGNEITIMYKGNRYSSYFWDSSSRLACLEPRKCSQTALQKALSQRGSKHLRSGKFNAVIDSEVSSKFVSPLLRALSGYSLQQNNSFLMDSLGKQLFPQSLTLRDCPKIPKECCSKLFDSEGVATKDCPIIENGVVTQYFINTYMSRKMNIQPTIEDATRPVMMPLREGFSASDVIAFTGEGIYVTDFNGGNCNSVTGDFSYGIEGFYFKDGEILRPVSGMLMTGNMLSLWSSLICSGDDARRCMSKLIPTLAFSDVDFSA